MWRLLIILPILAHCDSSKDPSSYDSDDIQSWDLALILVKAKNQPSLFWFGDAPRWDLSENVLLISKTWGLRLNGELNNTHSPCWSAKWQLYPIFLFPREGVTRGTWWCCSSPLSLTLLTAESCEGPRGWPKRRKLSPEVLRLLSNALPQAWLRL